MKKMMAVTAATVMGLSTLFSSALPAVAGRVGGPTRTVNMVYGADCDDYSVTFRGGQRARVWAVGDGDIDIVIYDAAGNTVVSDTLSDRSPVVSWTPRYTRTYTICVKNAEVYDVDYVVFTN